MTFEPLPQSTPSAEGVHASGIERFLDAAARTDGVELHSLMILRHGKVIASGWWAPYRPDGVHLLYSLSKSFTATALGIAEAAGLLRLSDTVLSYFPELDDDVTDPRSRTMRLSDLAAMSSGHTADTWDTVLATDPDHPVRAFLTLPPQEEPGSVFCYNQACPYTLATILQRVTGMTLTDYLRATVLDAVGAGPVAWTQHPVGQDQGFSGLHATTDTIARLGELYLRDGVWNGRRLLPEGWVERASSVHSATDAVEDAAVGDKADWKLGYGYQFWRSTHGYRADGAFGQYALILPELDAVVATTGQNTETQALLRLVWSELLPAFDAPGSSADDDRRLAERMANLELPTQGGAASPSDPDAWSGAVFAPGEGREATPAVKSVTVQRDRGDFELAIDEGDAQFRLPVAATWQSGRMDEVEAPVFASGGWQSDGSLRVQVAFVETPHRLVLDCDLADGTFAARWIAPPRRIAPLSSFRAPWRTAGD